MNFSVGGCVSSSPPPPAPAVAPPAPPLPASAAPPSGTLPPQPSPAPPLTVYGDERRRAGALPGGVGGHAGVVGGVRQRGLQQQQVPSRADDEVRVPAPGL